MRHAVQLADVAIRAYNTTAIDPVRLDAILRLLRMKVDHRDLRVYESETGNGGWKRAKIEEEQ